MILFLVTGYTLFWTLPNKLNNNSQTQTTWKTLLQGVLGISQSTAVSQGSGPKRILLLTCILTQKTRQRDSEQVQTNNFNKFNRLKT